MKKGTILGTIAGVVLGGAASGSVMAKRIFEQEKKTEKFKQYYHVLNKWMQLNQKGISLEKYFLEHDYHTAAIYGMGEVGNLLWTELKNSDVKVEYGIDKGANACDGDLMIVDIDDNLQPVDVVVVTAMFVFDEIAEKLEEKLDCPILSLEDVVYEITQE